MSSAPAATEVKRAKPALNVYTGLLVVALLMAILAAAVVAMSNMDSTGKGPFDLASGR